MTRRCHLTGKLCPAGCVPVLCTGPADAEPDAVAYLRDLAFRLIRVPVVHGTDQGDVDRLNRIATQLERLTCTTL